MSEERRESLTWEEWRRLYSTESKKFTSGVAEYYWNGRKLKDGPKDD